LHHQIRTHDIEWIAAKVGAASWVVCPLVVIARSEATKQSIYPRVKDWIASLRSQ
jgi:hypothetical protein